MVRVQGILPNMDICPNLTRKSHKKCYVQISSFFLHFPLSSPRFFAVSIFRFGPSRQPLVPQTILFLFFVFNFFLTFCWFSTYLVLFFRQLCIFGCGPWTLHTAPKTRWQQQLLSIFLVKDSHRVNTLISEWIDENFA